MAIDCHALHLRNLTQFFSLRRTSKKKDKLWRACDYVCSRSSVPTIDKKLRSEIQNYTSRSTCHLLNQRLNSRNKQQAYDCYRRAFPVLKKCMRVYLDALEVDAKQRFKIMWQDKQIQNEVACVRCLLGEETKKEQGAADEP